MELYDICRTVQSVSLVLWTAWLFAYLSIDNPTTTVGRVMRRYFFEMRPIIPAICSALFLAGAVRSGVEDVGFRIIVLLFGLGVWYLARHEDDDEDRWKKRLGAINSRVAQVGAKLRIVPAT